MRITSLVSFALLPRLSQANELFVNQTATVCGMGLELEQTWAVSTYLQYTDLKIISQQDCAKYFGVVDPKILCAKSPTTLASACSGLVWVDVALKLNVTKYFSGDSGSPLTIREGINAVIIGVVSFGAGSGCDLGKIVKIQNELNFYDKSFRISRWVCQSGATTWLHQALHRNHDSSLIFELVVHRHSSRIQWQIFNCQRACKLFPNENTIKSTAIN